MKTKLVSSKRDMSVRKVIETAATDVGMALMKVISRLPKNKPPPAIEIKIEVDGEVVDIFNLTSSPTTKLNKN